MNEGFLLSDATAAECRWPSQNDGEETEGKLSSTVMRRLVEINSQIHKRQHLFPELVGKELLCLCEQPECVFVPGES